MRRVAREEIVDFVTWEEELRPVERPEILAAKGLRRVVIGPLTFLFENALTVRYQVLEMMRVERIVRERDIQHELDTYNELLGGDGQLGLTLLISIQGEEMRAVKLREWLGLLPTLYMELADGTRCRGTWDERQVGTDRLSSVQYLKFQVGEAPVAVGCEHPDIDLRLELSPETRQALADDLA
jgi:hypothetical protein